MQDKFVAMLYLNWNHSIEEAIAFCKEQKLSFWYEQNRFYFDVETDFTMFCVMFCGEISKTIVFQNPE